MMKKMMLEREIIDYKSSKEVKTDKKLEGNGIQTQVLATCDHFQKSVTN